MVSRDQILGTTRHVALLSNPKNHSICLEIDTGQVQVYARAPELGEAHETVPVASGNGSVRIGFDARLLVAALAHIDTETDRPAERARLPVCGKRHLFSCYRDDRREGSHTT